MSVVNVLDFGNNIGFLVYADTNAFRSRPPTRIMLFKSIYGASRAIERGTIFVVGTCRTLNKLTKCNDCVIRIIGNIAFEISSSEIGSCIYLGATYGTRFAYFISMIRSVSCYRLWLIFSKSMVEGVFPDIWKVTSVTPISKSDERTDVTNYSLQANLN